jgi:hypothetical protein
MKPPPELPLHEQHPDQPLVQRSRPPEASPLPLYEQERLRVRREVPGAVNLRDIPAVNIVAAESRGAAAERERLSAEERENVWYCAECDRWQDKRTGCEADVRHDESERIRRELLEALDDIREERVVPGESCLFWVKPSRFLDAIDRACPGAETE